jgi:hypothetical protein
MPYEYGQIILVPVADGRGNVAPHPAVILSPTDQIVPGAKLRVVCVSTQLEDPCPPHPAAGLDLSRWHSDEIPVFDSHHDLPYHRMRMG